MLSDLQLWGVDKVDGGGVTIAGQVVCTNSGRWSVQREFNRRMKKRFEELGIEIYNPVQRMVALTQMQDESAQPDAGGRPAMTATAGLDRLAGDAWRPTALPSCTAPRCGRCSPRTARWRTGRRLRRAGTTSGLDTYMADGGRYRKRRHATFAARGGRADPSRSAPAALSEPRLQCAERRHRALVRSGAAGDRRRCRA